MHRAKHQRDILIAGGGLAGTLTALFLKATRPHLDILIFETGENRLRSQTWSFHQTDISRSAHKILDPFISCRWSGYDVQFPRGKKHIKIPYRTIRSEDFWPLADTILSPITVQAEVAEISSAKVYLSDGTTFSANAVLDARGLVKDGFCSATGWQKFVGLTVVTAGPHGIKVPMLMDATVAQRNAFRFFYVLPLSDDRLLIEDTYYSEDPSLDQEEILAEIAGYAEALKIGKYDVEFQETGILPLPLNTDYLLAAGSVGAIGMRGGFFHPTTGYSLPFAVKIAEKLSASVRFGSGPELGQRIYLLLRRERMEMAKIAKYFTRLNRMLFRAAEPNRRRELLQQFYYRKSPLIERFYSGEVSKLQKFQLISGRPPVPILLGLKHFFKDVSPATRPAKGFSYE